jgi:hypothetical protein
MVLKKDERPGLSVPEIYKMSEKRKSERYKASEVPVKVSFSFSGKKVEARAKIKDISKGGVYLDVEGVLLKGTKCELIFEGVSVDCIVTDNKKQQKGCGLKVISEGEAKGNFDMFVDIFRLKSGALEEGPKPKMEKSASQIIRKKTILFISSENFGFGAYVENQRVDANLAFLKCETESAVKEALKSGEIILIVIASKLTPSVSGLKFLEYLKNDGHDLMNVPVIFVGVPLSQHDRETAVSMGIKFKCLEGGQANPAGLRAKINKLLYS